MDTEKDMFNEERSASEDITDAESTVGVSAQDINEALREYGIEPEEDQPKLSVEEVDVNFSAPEKKKFPVQRTIIISAVALLFVAVVVFAVIFVYNVFFKPGIDGVWTTTDESAGNIFFVFDKEGNIEMDGGGVKYFGTYTMEKNDEGKDVIKSDFYVLGMYGGEGEVEYSSDKNTMTLKFSGMDLELKKSELPKLNNDPKKITHASADELGITSLNIDKSIVGTWSEDMYGTYTFNSNGTGSYKQDYQLIDYYGFGFGTEYYFNYTVYEGNILITLHYYSGESEDAMFSYGVDKGNLVIDGVGYKAVK